MDPVPHSLNASLPVRGYDLHHSQVSRYFVVTLRAVPNRRQWWRAALVLQIPRTQLHDALEADWGTRVP
jgi:hypothetical protein